MLVWALQTAVRPVSQSFFVLLLTGPATGWKIILPTGSQKCHLVREVSESLTGRIVVLDLLGFSEKEKG